MPAIVVPSTGSATMKVKTILGLSLNASLILGGVVIISNHVEGLKVEWLRQEQVRRICEQPGKVPADIRCAIWHYAERPEIVAAVAFQESRFKPHVCSKAGACGLMQFMEGTAREEGINRFDVVQSIKGGERYLKRLELRFGNLGLALAAYNWGSGNMGRWLATGAQLDRVPLETRNYVLSITGRPLDAWVKRTVNVAQLEGHVATIGREFRP
jgi:hypothetical protein